MKHKDYIERCSKALTELTEMSMYISFRGYFSYFRKKGLSHSQISTLHMLYHRSECTVGNVSRMLSVSNPAASQLLDQLVTQGIIERFGSSSDRRIRLHRLSEEGLRMMKESRAVKKDWFRLLADKLSEEELRTTTDALEVLNAKIRLFGGESEKCRCHKHGHGEYL